MITNAYWTFFLQTGFVWVLVYAVKVLVMPINSVCQSEIDVHSTSTYVFVDIVDVTLVWNYRIVHVRWILNYFLRYANRLRSIYLSEPNWRFKLRISYVLHDLNRPYINFRVNRNIHVLIKRSLSSFGVLLMIFWRSIQFLRYEIQNE